MRTDKRPNAGVCAWCGDRVGQRYYVILPVGDVAWVCERCEKRLANIRASIAEEALAKEATCAPR